MLIILHILYIIKVVELGKVVSFIFLGALLVLIVAFPYDHDNSFLSWLQNHLYGSILNYPTVDHELSTLSLMLDDLTSIFRNMDYLLIYPGIQPLVSSNTMLIIILPNTR
jgi:hypothetical protein